MWTSGLTIDSEQVRELEDNDRYTGTDTPKEEA